MALNIVVRVAQKWPCGTEGVKEETIAINRDWVYNYGSTIGISTRLKMHENIEKINFIKTVFVSISINRDMGLKWKLGQLVRTDLLPLKRISFSSTHCRSIVQ